MNDSSNERRLLDLARRMLAGEAIDWEKDGVAEDDVRAGMKQFKGTLGRPGRSTETRETLPPERPAPPPPPPAVPRREDKFIGDFRLVRKLGEGGMGVVYEAEQQHPRRPVALKVIRGGAHVSAETLKLFQREAQTLAHLRHPGIAALYETGATDDGLHFFAMELVRGSTLTAWLGQRPTGPLPPHEVRLRLSVFKKICDAVAYAHQKGVIHRDLKPANVLIPKVTAGSSMQDEVPDIKVLDFGLARITDSDVQATTYVTEMGKIQGTLPYMSPEQVRGNPDEIDLRTDVYSLGVMLYEIVTGALPYDIAKAQIPEAVRIICEQAPKSISASFSGTRHLDADVITIAGKCLEKEPSRRYQSAAALGEDVQRYLSDQPILARPPSAIYQFKKLAARHKKAVGFAATVFVLVATLAVTSTVQAMRLAKERDRAGEEAEAAKQVSSFLEKLFAINDPSESRGNTITAAELLEEGARKIDRELKDQPRTRARLLTTMGQTFMGLGMSDRATPLLETAARATTEAFGADSVAHASILVELGLSDLGVHASSNALRHAREALAIVEKKLPPDDSLRLKANWLLANGLLQAGDPQAYKRVLEDGLRVIESSSSPDDRLRIWFLNDIGLAELGLGKLDEARRYMEQALHYREQLFPDELSPERILGMNNLAAILMLQSETARARPIIERCVRNTARVYGESHLRYAEYLDTLAELDRRESRLGDARAHVEQAIAIYTQRGLRRSSFCAGLLLTTARIEIDEGHLGRAEALLREILGTVVAEDGYDSPGQLDAMDELIRVLKRTNREKEAVALEARAREIRFRSGQQASRWSGVVVPSARIDRTELN